MAGPSTPCLPEQAYLLVSNQQQFNGKIPCVLHPSYATSRGRQSAAAGVHGHHSSVREELQAVRIADHFQEGNDYLVREDQG